MSLLNTMSALVANELLCYVQNNVTKHPRALMGVAVNGFYTDDEVSYAKVCLHGILADMNIDGLPRLIRRLPGDNRRKLETDDILGLFACADSAACSLPTFVAVNLQRVPSVTPGDMDVYALAASVASLTAQLEALAKRVELSSIGNEVVTMTQMEAVTKRLDGCEAVLARGVVAAIPGVQPVVGSDAPTSGNVNMLWAQRLVQSRSVDPASRRLPVVRVKGSRAHQSVKAVPRSMLPPLLKAFVGRLDPETTDEVLREFLVDAGLKVVHCRRLSPPTGKTFKTAAFYVACEADCEDSFYKEETWPEGAELRDWYTN